MSRESLTSEPDLIQRLREYASEINDGDDIRADLELFKSAADCIERLQRERDEDALVLAKLQDKWASRPLDHPNGEALIAENDRLRAALKRIAAVSGDAYLYDAQRIAREALEGGEK